jgi:hypothetical protein
VTFNCGVVPLSLAAWFSLQLSSEVVGQAVAGIGPSSGRGTDWFLMTPVNWMLSSHQPSSCGVLAQPGPIS